MPSFGDIGAVSTERAKARLEIAREVADANGIGDIQCLHNWFDEAKISQHFRDSGSGVRYFLLCAHPGFPAYCDMSIYATHESAAVANRDFGQRMEVGPSQVAPRANVVCGKVLGAVLLQELKK